VVGDVSAIGENACGVAGAAGQGAGTLGVATDSTP
jgi:hypothetical protein